MKLFASVLSLTAFAVGSAQSSSGKGAIRVTVTDLKDSALVGAEVRFPTLDVGFTVPRNGVLMIKDVRSGTYVLQARHVGYALASKLVTVSGDTAAVRFALEGGVTLDTMRVDGVATGWAEEFERHRKLGFGQFFTAQDLAGQERLSTFLGKARGVKVTVGSPDVLQTIRGGRCSSLEIYVDGFPMAGLAAMPAVATIKPPPPRDGAPSSTPPRVTVGANSTAGTNGQQGQQGTQPSGSGPSNPRSYATANALANSGEAKSAPTSSLMPLTSGMAFDINALQASSVAAIEVYVDANSIPARYRHANSECGAIFIWTK